MKLSRRGKEDLSSGAEDAGPGHETGFDQQGLRRKAMERLRVHRSKSSGMAPEDLASLLSELEIHQAELEVQNEELRRIQTELAGVRDRYRDLYEFAPVGYLTLDTRGLICQINLAVSRLWGLERESAIGKRVESLMVPEDRDACYLMLRQAAASGNNESLELRLLRPDGSNLWVRTEVSPLPRTAGLPGGFRMTLADIHARKQAEEALRQLNEQLEEKVAERTAELERIVGMLRAEVMQRQAAEKALKEANDQLVNRAAQLRALAGELTLAEQRERRKLVKVLHDHLQQMLVAAKLRVAVLRRTSDRFTQAATGQIEQLLDECIATARSLTAELSPPILHEGGLGPGLEWLSRRMLKRQGLTVNLAFDEQIAFPLPEDLKVFLFESVQELLFNTVKHARVSVANVDVRRVGDNILQVTVCDAGLGFESAKIRPAGEPGGGFGLFSIRERLGLFGGRMEITSAPGHGSRFILSVPIAAPVATETHTDAPPDGLAVLERAGQRTTSVKAGSIRVMLADDHVVMRQGLARLLAEEPDIEIIGEATDGQEAVELAGKLLPDVILMDMSMPKLNGLEATRTICDDHPSIRVIGLSMFEEAERAQAMLDAGAVTYLAKTGPSCDLIAAIRNCDARRPDMPQTPGKTKKPH